MNSYRIANNRAYEMTREEQHAWCFLAQKVVTWGVCRISEVFSSDCIG